MKTGEKFVDKYICAKLFYLKISTMTTRLSLYSNASYFHHSIPTSETTPYNHFVCNSVVCIPVVCNPVVCNPVVCNRVVCNRVVALTPRLSTDLATSPADDLRPSPWNATRRAVTDCVQ